MYIYIYVYIELYTKGKLKILHVKLYVKGILKVFQWYEKGVFKVCYRQNQDIVNYTLRYIDWLMADISNGILNAI